MVAIAGKESWMITGGDSNFPDNRFSGSK